MGNTSALPANHPFIGAGDAGTHPVAALIPHSAPYPVITFIDVGNRFTTGRFVAGIVSARVGILTDNRIPRYTCAVRTCVRRGASIAVVARRQIVRIRTAVNRVTRIVGAEIVIVAIQSRTRNAPTVFTDVVHRADTAIVASHRIDFESAPAIRIAGIVRARITIGADESSGGDAFAQAAIVAGGT